MNRYGTWIRLLAAVLPAVVLLGACAGPPAPFVYKDERELKPGPGLFSGADGYFNIIGSPETAPDGPVRPAGESTRPGADGGMGEKKIIVPGN